MWQTAYMHWRTTTNVTRDSMTAKQPTLSASTSQLENLRDTWRCWNTTPFRNCLSSQCFKRSKFGHFRQTNTQRTTKQPHGTRKGHTRSTYTTKNAHNHHDSRCAIALHHHPRPSFFSEKLPIQAKMATSWVLVENCFCEILLYLLLIQILKSSESIENEMIV